MNDTQYKLLVGKKIRVRSNTAGHHYKIGEDYILSLYRGNGTYRAKPVGLAAPDFYQTDIYYQDFDIIDNVTGDLEEKGFIKKVNLNEEKDNFGIEPVLELAQDEETIFISASARNLLEVEKGGQVGIAIDYDKDTVYIFKETEDNAGLTIDNDGNIKSFGIYRDLVNYVYSKTMSIEPRRVKNSDFADNVFYKVTKYNPNIKAGLADLFVEKPLVPEDLNSKEIKTASLNEELKRSMDRYYSEFGYQQIEKKPVGKKSAKRDIPFPGTKGQGLGYGEEIPGIKMGETFIWETIDKPAKEEQLEQQKEPQLDNVKF